MFSEQELDEIEVLKRRYPEAKAAVLPLLWKVQEKRGWIDEEGMELVAKLCDVPKSHVWGVVSFYTMYFEKPMGRYHVQVCTNVSCMLRGGEKLLLEMKARLGIDHMQRSEDGIFSLEEVECMGACGGAPMIAVNETFFERMSSDEAAEVINTIKASGTLPTPKPTVQLPELSLEANR